jgi:protease I
LTTAAKGLHGSARHGRFFARFLGMDELKGKKVAILVADGFEQVELTGPRERLERAGAKTLLVSLKRGKVRGFNHHDPGDAFDVDQTIDEASAADYDALLLPGGVMNPDALRTVPKVQSFVRDFASSGKLIAAICHGPWTLIDAGLARGKRMTSWPSLKTDLKNAGASWVDEECVFDGGVITSRKPSDIPAFADKIIEVLHRQGTTRQNVAAEE